MDEGQPRTRISKNGADTGTTGGVGDIRYFSAFAGIGGFDLGIDRVIPDAVCVGISEVDKHAIRVYENHFPDRVNYGDIRKIKTKDLPDFDLFCGGFPCQDVSKTGKRAGLCGARSGLFFEIVRIIRKKQPRLVFLENVKGLLSSNKGWDFARVLLELDGAGYSVEYAVLNSKDHGIPQNRERVFIIGHLTTAGGDRQQIFPLKENDKLYSETGEDQEKIHEISTCLTSGGNDKWNGTYIAHCLTGGGHSGGLHRQMDIVADGTIYRRFTPLECERLMGFPDLWTATDKDGNKIADTQRYKMLGNAVVVPVIEAIMEELKRTRA